MKYIDVQDGRAPTLGFGTFTIRGEDCVRATATALEIGDRHIDTAPAIDGLRGARRLVSPEFAPDWDTP